MFWMLSILAVDNDGRPGDRVALRAMPDQDSTDTRQRLAGIRRTLNKGLRPLHQSINDAIPRFVNAMPTHYSHDSDTSKKKPRSIAAQRWRGVDAYWAPLFG